MIDMAANGRRDNIDGHQGDHSDCLRYLHAVSSDSGQMSLRHLGRSRYGSPFKVHPYKGISNASERFNGSNGDRNGLHMRWTSWARKVSWSQDEVYAGQVVGDMSERSGQREQSKQLTNMRSSVDNSSGTSHGFCLRKLLSIKNDEYVGNLKACVLEK